MTETENSLSMITKAGVPSNKVLVGIASYGRSFKVAEPGCTGPRCRFVGIGEKHESAAKLGKCTKTAGYLSDYEIRQIIGEYDDPENWSADEDMVAENPYMFQRASSRVGMMKPLSLTYLSTERRNGSPGWTQRPSARALSYIKSSISAAYPTGLLT